MNSYGENTDQISNMAENSELSVGYLKRERKDALVKQYMRNKRLKDQMDKLKEENNEIIQEWY